MHHLTDVVGGAINGLACAELAAGCLVHRCGDKTDAPIRLANIAEAVPYLAINGDPAGPPS